MSKSLDSVTTLVLGYDSLLSIGVPLYHHQPELVDKSVGQPEAESARTTSKRKSDQFFTSYTLEELHSECPLCDQHFADSCADLVTHMTECFKVKNTICCGIQFGTIFDAGTSQKFPNLP